MKRWLGWSLALAALGLAAAAVSAQEVVFKDPVGDDDGPGTYTYPTDAVYTKGSFDITGCKFKVNGDMLDFAVDVNSKLDDPWRMGGGFSVQMIFIFIDTDHKDGSGFTDGAPGLDITFAPADAWDRCVILSPQPPNRVKTEVEAKCATMKTAILVPVKTKGVNRTISGSVALKDLGGGDPMSWGYQVCMQSNEGFPTARDLLVREVNEYEGQHRFGGGNDGDCDPQVIDILAGSAMGEKGEIDLQHKMLAYECNPDGTTKRAAVLTMVHPAKMK
jgi:carbohydrate-binding DOMON domain-containing protein